MASEPQQSKRRNAVASVLDMFIQTLNDSKGSRGVPPAQAALESTCTLLTTMKMGSTSFLSGELVAHSTQRTTGKRDDFVDLGLSCADVCEALDRALDGKRSDDLSEPACKAIEKLTT